MHEGQDFVGMIPEAFQQVAGLALLASSPTFWCLTKGIWVLGIAGVDNAAVAGNEPVKFVLGQSGQIAISGGFDTAFDLQ